SPGAPSGVQPGLTTPLQSPLNVRACGGRASSISEGTGAGLPLWSALADGFRVRASCPAIVSHNFTVPSRLAEARRAPSGLKATPPTPAVLPLARPNPTGTLL